MKPTKSQRGLEKVLLIVISLLLIFIGIVLTSRIVPVPFGPEVSTTKTSDTATIAADGFTTVFMLADNASPAVKAYQERFLQNIGTLAIGVIALLYAGALLVYSLIFRLRPKRATYTIAIMGLSLIWVGIAGQNIFKVNEVQDESDCVSLQSIYDSRQYSIAEGMVHVSHVQSASGHDRGDNILVFDQV